MDSLSAYISGNYIELIAAFLGLISIYFQIRQRILYWPVSIVVVLLYIVVYYDAKLYADISLQVYYLVISVYGWINWAGGNRKNSEQPLRVSKAGISLLIKSVVAVALLFAFLSWLLIRFTDSNVPYWDALINAISFVATWMLARKIIENWIFWIIADFLSIGIYIYKQLYPTMILFIVLTILAFAGYYQWKKDMKLQTA